MSRNKKPDRVYSDVKQKLIQNAENKQAAREKIKKPDHVCSDVKQELIQNAEDAGATVVKILTDRRQFHHNIDPRTLKRHPHLKYFKVY